MCSSLLTTAQVAELLNVAPLTIYKLRARGDGPAFVRVGRSVRYRPEDVESWLAAQTKRTPLAS